TLDKLIPSAKNVFKKMAMPAARIFYIELAARRRSLAPIRYTDRKMFTTSSSTIFVGENCLVAKPLLKKLFKE
ncbi:MAG: hypothetical protein WBZ48_08820, partial [Bacteroidota bacterium]